MEKWGCNTVNLVNLTKQLLVGCKQNGSTMSQSKFVRNANDFVCITNDLFVITNAVLLAVSS